MLLFQFEGIAEQWLSMDDFTNMWEWCHHPQLAGDQAPARASRAA